MTKLAQALILLSFIALMAPVEAEGGIATQGSQRPMKRDFADFSGAMDQPGSGKSGPPEKRFKRDFGDFAGFEKDRQGQPLDFGRNNPFNPQLAWKPKTDAKGSFAADFMVVMATMFPKSGLINRVPQEMQSLVQAKQDFFKRLMLLLLFNPPRISNISNDPASRVHDNVIPIASYLMRGGRLMVDMVNVPTKDFMAALLGGGPKINFFRKAASHGMNVRRDGTLEETKLGLGVGTVRNLYYGASNRYFSVNMPMGGFGNPGPGARYVIGADGSDYHNSHSMIQHGHVFIHPSDFGSYVVPYYLRKALGIPPEFQGKSDRSGVLIGIEVNAPGTTSPYGQTHGISSAFRKNTVEDPSITNSSKWGVQDGLALQPKKYGGMVIYADRDAIQRWTHFCALFAQLSEGQQEAFLGKWLNMSAKELADRHREMIEELRGLSARALRGNSSPRDGGGRLAYMDAPPPYSNLGKRDLHVIPEPGDNGRSLEGNLSGPPLLRQETDVSHRALPAPVLAPGQQGRGRMDDRSKMAPLDSPHRRPSPDDGGRIDPRTLSQEPPMMSPKEPPRDQGGFRAPTAGRPLPTPPDNASRDRRGTVYGKMPAAPPVSSESEGWIQPDSSSLSSMDSSTGPLKRRGTSYSPMPSIPVPAR